MTRKLPKYKTLTFETEEGFDTWLKTMAKKIIHFKDEGQDLIIMWVDSEGEILHCNLQTSIWCGRFVNMDKLEVGHNIELQDTQKDQWNQMKFIIDKVEDCA